MTIHILVYIPCNHDNVKLTVQLILQMSAIPISIPKRLCAFSQIALISSPDQVLNWLRLELAPWFLSLLIIAVPSAIAGNCQDAIATWLFTETAFLDVLVPRTGRTDPPLRPPPRRAAGRPIRRRASARVRGMPFLGFGKWHFERDSIAGKTEIIGK
jgi:hypothetical protein